MSSSGNAPGQIESPQGRRVRVPQQARSRRTRRRIVEAAVHCFETRGYDATTTAMIAARAGIAVGTLYGYFRDKREILLELLDHTMDEIAGTVIERLRSRAPEASDPRERVALIIDAVFHMQTLRPGIQRLLWGRYFKDPDFHAPIEETRTRLRHAVVAFAGSLDPHLLRPGLDLETASLVIVNAVQWNALHAFIHADDESRAAAARATTDMVSHYLFRDATAPGETDAG